MYDRVTRATISHKFICKILTLLKFISQLLAGSKFAKLFNFIECIIICCLVVLLFMLNMYANEGEHVNKDPPVASTVMALKLSMFSSTIIIGFW